MQTAITPGRTLPPSIADALVPVHRVLVPYDQLVPAFAARGYYGTDMSARRVADEKRLIPVLFRRKIEP